MKSRILALLVALALAVAAPASNFDFIDNSVAATAISTTLVVGTTTRPMGAVRIINDGAAEVFVRFFRTGETIVAAEATDSGGYRIDPAESYSRSIASTTGQAGYVAITFICSGGENTTLRVWGQAR